MDAWEFEGYRYIQFPDSLPLCMNSEEAVEYVRGLRAVADAAREVWADTTSRIQPLGYWYNVDPGIMCALKDALDELGKEPT